MLGARDRPGGAEQRTLPRVDLVGQSAVAGELSERPDARPDGHRPDHDLLAGRERARRADGVALRRRCLADGGVVGRVDGRTDGVDDRVEAVELGRLPVQLREPEVRAACEGGAGERAGQALAREPDPARVG